MGGYGSRNAVAIGVGYTSKYHVKKRYQLFFS
ncbi:hypothetical protein MY823_05725 [Haemophilus influenzae]|nr:hypothetical protein [Haemophilus influenzae]MCK8946892.1 hypothetical protein [Haemophilus influenzae]MCK9033851.1 hypothetical protein [Haemophilus influenzae]